MAKFFFHLYTLWQLLELRIKEISLSRSSMVLTLYLSQDESCLSTFCIPPLPPNFYVTYRGSDYLCALHMLWDRVCVVSDLRELGALENIVTCNVFTTGLTDLRESLMRFKIYRYAQVVCLTCTMDATCLSGLFTETQRSLL
jgi:hypothetical protein